MRVRTVRIASLCAAAMAAVVTGFATTENIPSPPAESSASWVQEAQTKLAATFTHLKFERVSASDIPGVVEIYAGPRILYYAPDQQILILGEMYDASGTSLTEQKIAFYAAEKTSTLDKDAALVVGEGSRELIVFVDPDCGYCKAAHRWLSEQQLPDTRQLIYFMPTPGRPSAQARAMRALCAPPAGRAAALSHVFEPSNEQDAADESQCPGVQARLNKHAQMAERIGVYASPFFIINKQVVAGFNAERLKQLLGTHPEPL